MKKTFFFSLLILLTAVFSSSAQSDYEFKPERKFKKERLFFGGGLGLYFGNVTVVGISPIVGYFVTEKLAFGVGPLYEYQNRPAYYQYSAYGGRTFARYYIIEYIFAHTEYEALRMNLSLKDSHNNTYAKDNANVSGLLIGGGVNIPMGRNSGLGIMLLYDLLENKYTRSPNPNVRIGFIFGL